MGTAVLCGDTGDATAALDELEQRNAMDAGKLAAYRRIVDQVRVTLVHGEVGKAGNAVRSFVIFAPTGLICELLPYLCFVLTDSRGPPNLSRGRNGVMMCKRSPSERLDCRA